LIFKGEREMKMLKYEGQSYEGLFESETKEENLDYIALTGLARTADSYTNHQNNGLISGTDAYENPDDQFVTGDYFTDEWTDVGFTD